VYASALSIEYSGLPQSDWAPLAELVLEAAYEATLRAALIHARPVGGRKTVVLTALGGGVFGNDMNLIARVIVNAIKAFQTEGLDIVINEYRGGDFKEIRIALLADAETKDLLVPQGQGNFGSDRRLPRPAVLYTE
jgi:O-acetyl-ADP-ribose deacetylase (regulator of RNase III)